MRKSRFLPGAILLVGGGLGVLSALGEGRWRAVTILVNLASPWALGALVVGRLAASPRRGAVAGGLTLVVAMATFYGLTTSGPYVHSTRDLVWTIVAVVVGPVMGMCGALLSSRQGGAQTAAAVAPSAILLAEAIWTGVDRRVWLWNLSLEPYRFTDVVILVGLVATAFGLPLVLVRERGPLLQVYLATVVGGVIGAGGLASLQWILLHV